PGLVMSTTLGDDLTGLLRRTQAGDTDAGQQVVALLYQDLWAVAARRMRRERPGHTWQPLGEEKRDFLVIPLQSLFRPWGVPERGPKTPPEPFASRTLCLKIGS